MIADDAQVFAQAAVRLHEDENTWLQAQQNGLEILHDRFDRAETGVKILRKLDALVANLAEHRRLNFTGSMLRHHLHKSTHYMSRWIESKNRVLQLERDSGECGA